MTTFESTKAGNLFKVDKSFFSPKDFRVELVAAKTCKVCVLCEFLTDKARQLLAELNVVAVRKADQTLDFKATNLGSSTKKALSNLLCDASQVTQGMTWK